MNIPINLVMLVSYDYKFVYTSLPLLYQYMDKICLSIDKKRLTWTGNIFNIDDSFFEWIREIDKEQKIYIYEDDFYISNNTPKENDIRQRNMSRDFIGSEGWCIQIDSDEYFYDFGRFITFLKNISPKGKMVISCKLIPIYKMNENGYFIINTLETVNIAAINFEKYTGIRGIAGAKKIKTFFTAFHQSWARSEDEIRFKFANWGHANDFNSEIYYEQWRNLTDANFIEYTNVHPSKTPQKWPSISYIPNININNLIMSVRDIKRKIIKQRFLKYCLKFYRPGFFQ